ncbi:hypothetical protein [Lysinibacillus sp. 54212]|uniref:hypothetical protein n=1 Tax=Lysinibacillus sp. 54212 TaxID=3119829 RepID=UPI002FC63664
MVINIESKDYLFQQLNGLIQLNNDTKNFIVGSQNSLLPEIEEWIETSKKYIEQNDWLIGIIKDQLLRDYMALMSPVEINFLNTI